MTVESTGGGIRPQIPFQVITPDLVRASIKRARKSLEAAAAEIVWQIEREAWVTLGYSSWTAMREAEYGGAAFMVPAKSRPEIVARIREAGLTQQEIAATAGVSQSQVQRDVNTHLGNEERATVVNSRGQERPTTYQRSAPDDDIIDAEIVEDEPAPPTRKPLPAEPPTVTPSRELTIVNDIRLYVGKIGTAPEIARLSPKAKQHIIDALTNAINELREDAP